MTIIKSILNFINNWMLVFAMLLGAVLYKYVSPYNWFFPYCIFTMLFLTFSKIDLHSIKFNKSCLILLAVQIFGCIAMYFLLSAWNVDAGQAALICLFTPTATAAPVITGMLGGNIGFLTSYTLIINLVVTLASPILFSFVGVNSDLTFFHSFGLICQKVFPILFLPLFLALLIRKALPKVNAQILRLNKINFYLWSFSLVLVSGDTVVKIQNFGSGNMSTEIILSLIALILCLFQFKIGRKIGKHFGDKISFGQALGQKNTLLAIWMAHTYLNPIVAISPAMYIIWQNIINSIQLMRHKRETESKKI